MLLEVKDIKVHYGKLEALKGVSLEVEQGAIVSLIGANGAGKTTTLRAISGLNPPTSGEIWFLGKLINHIPVEKIVSMGIAHVPQGRALFPYMTVLENLRMGAYLRKDKMGIERGMQDIFERFPRLKERRKQAAGSLSGGEQQMLAIARALMASPKLLLMDEPTLGLSPLLVRELANIITSLNQGGISILLVEQNAIMALTHASKGYVLETGRIVLEGSANNLLRNEHVKRAFLGG